MPSGARHTIIEVLVQPDGARSISGGSVWSLFTAAAHSTTEELNKRKKRRVIYSQPPFHDNSPHSDESVSTGGLVIFFGDRAVCTCGSSIHRHVHATFCDCATGARAFAYLASLVKHACIDRRLLRQIAVDDTLPESASVQTAALAFREWCEVCAAQELLRTGVFQVLLM